MVVSNIVNGSVLPEPGAEMVEVDVTVSVEVIIEVYMVESLVDSVVAPLSEDK